MTAQIEYLDFEKVDIRAGRIVDVQEFPEARKPAYKIWVDFGDTLGVKAKEYVEAARVIGLPDRIILVRHVLPNVTTSIIVLSTLNVGGFILAEATLSFLGVGVPVTRPSLGLLVKNGFDVLFSGYWWVAVFPGLFIMVLIFGINLLGDFLKDELNPRLK